MMKKVLIILFFGIACNNGSDKKTAAQSMQVGPLVANEDLSKYSYELFGYKVINDTTYPTNATCFFIRNSKRLLAVTAKHVFTGCGSEKKKPNYPDTLNIVLKSLGSLKLQWTPIDIRATLKLPCVPFYESPDIFAVEINGDLINDPRVYSVEQFLKPMPLLPGDINVYGFPVETSKLLSDGTIVYPDPSHLHLLKDDIIHVDKSYISAISKWEYFNYRAVLKVPDFSKSYYGYSGSPVFYTDQTTGDISIQGVFSGVSKDKLNNKMTYDFCKINFLLSQK